MFKVSLHITHNAHSQLIYFQQKKKNHHLIPLHHNHQKNPHKQLDIPTDQVPNLRTEWTNKISISATLSLIKYFQFFKQPQIVSETKKSPHAETDYPNILFSKTIPPSPTYPRLTP